MCASECVRRRCLPVMAPSAAVIDDLALLRFKVEHPVRGRRTILGSPRPCSANQNMAQMVLAIAGKYLYLPRA